MGKLSCGLTIPGVFEKGGRYYRVRRNEWLPLSRIDEGQNALLAALLALDPRRPGTIGELMSFYRAAGMDALRPATQVDYGKILDRLDVTFGHVKMGTLKPSHVAVFLETRRKAGKGATRANREFAVLSSVHNFGMRQGWIESNPCIGVRRNTEKPRTRIVTDAEFLDAFNRSNEPFQDLIAADYLSGVRQADILAWTPANLKADGIHFVQSKTRKPQVVTWSDALRFFVRRAMERFPDGERIFLNTDGKPWTIWAINSQIDRLKVDWCFKDLRAKAQTDSPHSVLGHGAALEAVYRKTIRTKPVR